MERQDRDGDSIRRAATSAIIVGPVKIRARGDEEVVVDIMEPGAEPVEGGGAAPGTKFVFGFPNRQVFYDFVVELNRAVYKYDHP